MREVVIVLIVRIGLVKFMCGGFNMIYGVVMGGSVIKGVIERVGIDFGDVEDVFMGCG